MPHRRLEIAQRLTKLIDTMRRPDGSRWTDRAIADALTDSGYKVSHTTIWALRTGETANPPVGTLQALADLFGVNLAYFVDDEAAARIEPQLELADRLRNADVRAVALRAADLTPEGLRSAMAILDQIAALERRNRPNE